MNKIFKYVIKVLLLSFSSKCLILILLITSIVWIKILNQVVLAECLTSEFWNQNIKQIFKSFYTYKQ